MDELLKEFLTETTEHIEGVENQLVLFERNPTDASLVAGIFRLVHTIKGTSSFLGLTRLPHVAHSAETLIGMLRDGAAPTPRMVSLILAAIDRLKSILHGVDDNGAEPEGDDTDIVNALDAAARGEPEAGGPAVASAEPAQAAPAVQEQAAPEPVVAAASEAAPDAPQPAAAMAEHAPVAAAAPAAPAAAAVSSSGPAAESSDKHGGEGAAGGGGARGGETIRVAVDTIERIMQLVSELVLTRNQLLELTRHREEDAVKAPLQRLSALTTDLQDAVMRARMQPVGRLFSSLPRLIRELCTELTKKSIWSPKAPIPNSTASSSKCCATR